MRHQLFPIHINLSHVPEEGRLFTYSREEGQLNKELDDLIGSNEYLLKFFIQPLGSHHNYELRGHIETYMELLCSLCAQNLKWPFRENLNEILIIEPQRPRNSKESRVNHISEFTNTNLFCHYLQSEVFSVLDFVREVINLAEPYRPLASPDCEEGSCPNLTEKISLKLSEIRQQQQNPNPFFPFENLKHINFED